jgi:galactokinase
MMPTNLFDKSPTITATAPGRANLIGEHVDYAGGVVLPFAISYRTTVGISHRNDHTIRIRSAQSKDEIELQIDEIPTWRGPTWARYILGVLDVMHKDMPGLDIQIDGRVPQGAGLSSSAALECATALSLNQLFGLGYSPLELAQIAQKAENDYVGMPCGLMDQAASILSQENNILQLDCLSLETNQVPFNLASHDLSILLIDSQVKHELVDGGYANRFKACETARTTLGLDSLRHLTRSAFESANLDPLVRKRVGHVVGEMERVHKTIEALKGDDFYSVGKYMNQTHASLRDLYEVSCVELDLAAAIACDVGALGARIMGGGFGGSAIVLTPKSLESKIVNAVEKAFAEKNYNAPRCFSAEPSVGARVEN